MEEPGEEAAALVEAEVLLALGRRAEAATALRRALVVAPGDPGLLSLLAEALLGDEPAAAARVAGEAVTAAPDREHGHRVLASALLALDRADEALPAALASVRLAPTSAEPLATLAHALAATGDVRGAIAAAGRAVEVEPGSASGWFAQGVIALRGHQWPTAEANFQRVLAIDPGHGGAQDGLRVVRRQQGWKPAREGPWWSSSPSVYRGAVIGAVVVLAVLFLLAAVLG